MNFEEFDLSSFSIQGALDWIKDFGYVRIGIIIAILAVFVALIGIAGRAVKVVLLLLAAIIAALFAYSGTREVLLDIPDRVSALVHPSLSGSGGSSPVTSEQGLGNSDDSDGWVTVSSSGGSDSSKAASSTAVVLSLADVPAYSGEAVFDVANLVGGLSIPEFDSAYVSLSDLDSLGRCQEAFAVLGPELLPDQERGEIGMIKPSGWQTVKYPDLIDDIYLYNRSHLLAYQATGINADERNLITGTRYMNVSGMEPYENLTTWYIKDTGNHVVYRVVPVFEGDNLVCDGVLMQALSVEDEGEGVNFNVFCYNVQPGIVIDYSTGESRVA